MILQTRDSNACKHYKFFRGSVGGYSVIQCAFPLLPPAFRRMREGNVFTGGGGGGTPGLGFRSRSGGLPLVQVWGEGEEGYLFPQGQDQGVPPDKTGTGQGGTHHHLIQVPGPVS